MGRRLLVLGAFLAFAPAAHAAGPTMLFGANDDTMLQKTLPAAKANMTLVRLAGFRAVSLKVRWVPGLTEPPGLYRLQLGNLAKASRLTGTPVYISLMNARGRFAPTTDETRAQFVQFAVSIVRTFPAFTKIIVGNEPNLNLFWAPQFALDGSDAAATGYEQLLADVYDGLKAVTPKIKVIGGAVSPRGHDDPNGSSLSHSPTTFLRDLGAAYKASGRTTPIMDWLAYHPYGASSSEPPSTHHSTSTSITINDYGKLIKILGQAFDGTAQPGSTIPIVYDEYGIQSTIPAKKARKYTGNEQPSTKAVSLAVQGERYREAVQLAYCQPTVRAMFLFPAIDERDRRQWQSGVYYVDHTAKPSLAVVRGALQEAKRGVLAHCAGLRLRVKAKVTYPSPGAVAAAAKRGSALTLRVRCSLDCRYTIGLTRIGRLRPIITRVGIAIGTKPTLVKLRGRRLSKGRYRFQATLVAPVNPGPVVRSSSRVFSVR